MTLCARAPEYLGQNSNDHDSSVGENTISYRRWPYKVGMSLNPGIQSSFTEPSLKNFVREARNNDRLIQTKPRTMTPIVPYSTLVIRSGSKVGTEMVSTNDPLLVGCR